MSTQEVANFTGDTEYLTKEGWKRFDEFQDSDLVAQYNPEQKEIEFVKPTSFSTRDMKALEKLEARGLDFTFAPEQKIAFFNDLGDKDKIRYITFEEALRRHAKSKKKGWTGAIKTDFASSAFGIDLSDDEIRLMVAYQADGTRLSSKKGQIVVSKERKRFRLIDILERLGLEYTEKVKYEPKYTNSTGFHFRFPIPRDEKTFGGYWYSCSQHQLEVVMDEVGHWDGSFVENQSYQTVRYFSTIKENIDFIQYAAHACGFNTSIVKDIREHKYTKNDFWTLNCTPRGNGKRRFTNKDGKRPSEIVNNESGLCYGFKVSSGYIPVRINEKLFITGCAN